MGQCPRHRRRPRYCYKARIYSPTLGRFLQTDPIGYEDQYNLYAYVGNDPINGIDPTGLFERGGTLQHVNTWNAQSGGTIRQRDVGGSAKERQSSGVPSSLGVDVSEADPATASASMSRESDELHPPTGFINPYVHVVLPADGFEHAVNVHGAQNLTRKKSLFLSQISDPLILQVIALQVARNYVPEVVRKNPNVYTWVTTLPHAVGTLRGSGSLTYNITVKGFRTGFHPKDGRAIILLSNIHPGRPND